MALGPLAPTVYSVARTLSAASSRALPSGMIIWACVPCGKSTVAWRVPWVSVTALARATCMGVVEVRSMAVTCGSNGVRTTSGTAAWFCQGTFTCRWTGRWSVFWY
jgi:hypothetical protein